jgi:hypothetical protein
MKSDPKLVAIRRNRCWIGKPKRSPKGALQKAGPLPGARAIRSWPRWLRRVPPVEGSPGTLWRPNRRCCQSPPSLQLLLFAVCPWVNALAQQLSRGVSLFTRIKDADFGKRPEAQHVFPACEAIAPELCAGRRHQEMQAEAVRALVRLLSRLRVLDRELGEHAGTPQVLGERPPQLYPQPYPQICVLAPAAMWTGV